MKRKISIFLKKPFIRNVLIMASGTAGAQAIAMVLSPIITRLYGPEIYGLMGIFTSIVAIIIPVSALTYPAAIVLPNRLADAKGLIRLSLYLATTVAIMSLIIIVVFRGWITRIFNIEGVSEFLYLIPFVILFSGLLQVVEQWLIRTKQFKLTAKVNIFHSLIVQGSKVGFGLYYPFASVLISLTALGHGMKAVMMIFVMKQKSLNDYLNELNHSSSIRSLAKKYKSFPLYRAPEVFINAISQSLPVLLLTSFFGPVAAGFYTIGRTVLSLPSRLISKSVGDVFYPRVTEAANKNENITSLVSRATLALGGIGLLPFGSVMFFGPWLFSFIFGAEWSIAGEYARWIAFWTYFGFMNQPAVKTLPVLSAQSLHLKFTIYTLLLRTIALAIGYYVFSSDLVAVALFGISGGALNILLIILTVKASKKFNQRNISENGDKIE